MDQLPLAFAPPGLGHNHPPEPVDPIDGLNARLTETHTGLISRFRDLELGCARVPDPLESEEDAATLTDFIAQCQAQIRNAEMAHKQEKALFLRAGRAVDTFFKGRCEKLSMALAPAMARLKTFRDRVAVAERQRHQEMRRAAAEAAARAMAEAEAHHAAAMHLAQGAEIPADRHRAAEELRLAEEAAQRAQLAREEARAGLSRPGSGGIMAPPLTSPATGALRLSISTGCRATT